MAKKQEPKSTFEKVGWYGMIEVIKMELKNKNGTGGLITCLGLMRGHSLKPSIQMQAESLSTQTLKAILLSLVMMARRLFLSL